MRNCIRIVTWGGLGDVLLATPTLRALKEREACGKLIVYCLSWPHYEIYLHNPYIDILRPPGMLNRFERQLMKRFRLFRLDTPAYGLLHPSLLYTTRASEIIGEMFDVDTKDKRLMLFLTEEEQQIARQLITPYKVPVAIQIIGRCSKNKLWPHSNWTELVRRNPQYTFIQLGTSEEPLINGVVDLRGLPLRISLGVLKWVRSFVGIDSVLAHATNVFGTPGVVIFGPSTPIVWGHPNNKNLFAGLPCAPCIEILASAPCPYALPCMTTISTATVERALREQVAKTSPKP